MSESLSSSMKPNDGLSEIRLVEARAVDRSVNVRAPAGRWRTPCAILASSGAKAAEVFELRPDCMEHD